MTYKAHRDYRFEYASDVIHFIEENQCERNCAFAYDHSEEFAMCALVSGDLILEEPVEVLDDLGDNGVVCRKYRDKDLVEQEHPDQERLL